MHVIEIIASSPVITDGIIRPTNVSKECDIRAARDEITVGGFERS